MAGVKGKLELMEYVVQILEALSWPVVVLISIFALRKPLVELIPQLKKLKYKELEMEFEQELKTLREKSHKSRENIEIEPPKEEETDSYFYKLKGLSPRSAIMESWLALETTVISSARQFGVAEKYMMVHFGTALLTLRQSGILSYEDVSNLKDLQKLRNKAVHELDFSITESEAEQFIEIVREQAEIIASRVWKKRGQCNG